MKYSSIAVFSLISLQNAVAFTVPSSKRSNRVPLIGDVPRPIGRLYLATDGTEASDATPATNSSEGGDADIDPSFKANQQQLIDSKALAQEAEQRVQELEQRILDYEIKITEKENSLTDQIQASGEEKTTFSAKIAELTDKLLAKENEVEEKSREREEAMINTIDDIKEELKWTKNQLEEEKEIATQLREAIGTTQDKLEFAQMAFKKDTEALEQQILDRTSRLNDVEKSFNEDRSNFEQEKSVLEQQLEDESGKLAEAEKELAKVTEKFNQEQRTLQAEMDQLKATIENKELEIMTTASKFDEEREKMVRDAEEKKAKLKNTEDLLVSNERDFESSKLDLKQQIEAEKNRVTQLSKDLVDESDRFKKEKEDLESVLLEERTKLDIIQKELGKEVELFERERQNFKSDLEENVRIRQEKAKQMRKRYDVIRKEMTDLLNQTRKEARQDKEELKAKYERQLGAINTVVTDLESKLAASQSDAADAENRMIAMTRERDVIIEMGKSTEKRFQQVLSDKNLEIVTLQSNLEALTGISSKQEEKIEKYQGSFRQLAKLSVRLTFNRARNIFRRKKKD